MHFDLKILQSWFDAMVGLYKALDPSTQLLVSLGLAFSMVVYALLPRMLQVFLAIAVLLILVPWSLFHTK
jgi:hypothetical protein